MVLTTSNAAPKREQALQSSRQRIVETARALFLEKGYLGVSMQQIADAAGLRKASLYHHFPSKEALFSEVIAQEMDWLLEELESVDLQRDTFAEQLLRIALINSRRFNQPEFHQLVMDYFRNVPESGHAEVHKRLKGMQGTLSNYFAQAMQRGEIRAIEPTYAASLFFHMLMSLGADQFDHIGVAPPDPIEAATLVVEVLLNGLASRP